MKERAGITGALFFFFSTQSVRLIYSKANVDDRRDVLIQ